MPKDVEIVTADRIKEIASSIDHNENTIFSVVFIKRTTGEFRKMTCRRNVKKYLAGGKAAYNFKDHDLLPVFDINKQQEADHKGAYRSINLNALKELKLHGHVYRTQDYQDILDDAARNN